MTDTEISNFILATSIQNMQFEDGKNHQLTLKVGKCGDHDSIVIGTTRCITASLLDTFLYRL